MNMVLSAYFLFCSLVSEHAIYPLKQPGTQPTQFTVICGRSRRAVLVAAVGHVTRKLGLAELLGCASLFSPETALETQQTATKSPPCQTAKMTFAWKAAGLT
jgi:hypothetical protein